MVRAILLDVGVGAFANLSEIPIFRFHTKPDTKYRCQRHPIEPVWSDLPELLIHPANTQIGMRECEVRVIVISGYQIMSEANRTVEYITPLSVVDRASKQHDG